MAGTTKKKVKNEVADLTGNAVTLSGGSGEQVIGNKIAMLPVDDIRPFHKHPFRLYEGERLQDMVESVKEHGILNPVIVRTYNGTYEMLSGHNRQNAAKIAGIKEIPAIIKEKLSNEEAYVYVIETNLMQRSFTDLTTTEKAAVLAERYDKVLYQRKRDEIIAELKKLECVNDDESANGGHDVHHSKNRDSLGEEYGLSGRHVVRLMRVNNVIPEIKKRLDTGEMLLTVAVQLSYLPEQGQSIVVRVADEAGVKLTEKIAIAVRKAPMTEKGIKEAIVGEQTEPHPLGIIEDKKKIYKPVKLSPGLREKYFQGMKEKEIEEVVEKALKAWFKRRR